jgi:hypothetical protein
MTIHLNMKIFEDIAAANWTTQCLTYEGEVVSRESMRPGFFGRIFSCCPCRKEYNEEDAVVLFKQTFIYVLRDYVNIGSLKDKKIVSNAITNFRALIAQNGVRKLTLSLLRSQVEDKIARGNSKETRAIVSRFNAISDIEKLVLPSAKRKARDAEMLTEGELFVKHVKNKG